MLSVDSDILGIPVNIRALLGQQNPPTACFGNRVTGRGLRGLSRDLGLGVSALRTDIRAGLNDRYDANRREFPVAIVNCTGGNRFRLLSGQDVRVEAYAQVRMTERIDTGANVQLRLQFLGSGAPPPPQQTLRRYPVLVR